MKWWLIFIFLSISCVDEFRVDSNLENGQIIIEGLITNIPGEHKVKISITAAFQTSKPVEGANVKILEVETGELHELYEKSPGIYVTMKNYFGKTGNSYLLEVTTSEGKRYSSYPDIMNAEVPISDTYYSYNSLDDGFDVFINTDIPKDQFSQLRWKWFGTYLTKRECCDCWNYEFQAIPLLANSSLLQNQNKLKLKIAFIPVSPERFTEKYYIKVSQLNLSAFAFSFWNDAKNQLEAQTNFFQPSLGGISGNIYSLSNPKEQVHGIFYAAATSDKSFFIKREDVPYELDIISAIGTCINSDVSTNIRPNYWE